MYSAQYLKNYLFIYSKNMQDDNRIYHVTYSFLFKLFAQRKEIKKC